MWIKLWASCLLVTLVNSEYLYDANPYAHFGGYAKSYDNYKPTNYKFEYGVSDPTTGDHKSQWEVKENGVVRGAYSLLEPDGTTRLVEYYADDTGFHADVKKLGTSIHPAPEYGQLHSLSETHIANSLAYNGYGHGGVTHDYGAPIAAPIKIAAAPVAVQAAPLAEVQHIAPIPQVIAPQIHHLGSPHDYGYGQEVSHIYAPEKVYAPAPVLQHPAPFKIPEPHYLAAPAPVLKEFYEPQIVKQVAQPEIVKYAAPVPAPVIKEYYPDHQIVAQPEIVKYAPVAPAPVPTPIIKEYYPEPQIVKQVHVAQPEVKYSQVAGPVPEFYAKYIPEPAPAVVTKYAAPEPIVTKYAAPEPILEKYAAPEPILTKYVAPESVLTKYAAPEQIITKYAAPEQIITKYAAPEPILTKYTEPTYAPAPEYLPAPVYAAPAIPAPAPAPVAKVAVTKVQPINPIAKFFAPLTKYFAPIPVPAPVAVKAVVPAKVVPTQAVYAEAPAQVKYVDYDAGYQTVYKPEVVVSAPHNYGPHAGYTYSHDY